MMVKNGSRIQKYAKYFFILSETNLSCATVIRKYCLECAHNLQSVTSLMMIEKSIFSSKNVIFTRCFHWNILSWFGKRCFHVMPESELKYVMTGISLSLIGRIIESGVWGVLRRTDVSTNKVNSRHVPNATAMYQTQVSWLWSYWCVF